MNVLENTASPGSAISEGSSASRRSSSSQLPGGKVVNGIKPTQPIPPKSTIIKTDKPRPHICTTCTRSFARLEHLKRHERSHTKEKPFQCPVCERCFSRRDLLLRHKQKLHASFPESPKARGSGSVRRKSLTTMKKEEAHRSSSVSSGSYPMMESSAPPKDQSSINHQDQIPNNLLQFEDDLDAIIKNAVVATQGSLEYSNFLKNKVGASNGYNRQRYSSFSAVSATSYSKLKDEEAIQKSLYPMNGPSEVGFSTPQLLPASMEGVDTPIDDLFDQSDPLFINPQQLLGQQQAQQAQQNQPKGEVSNRSDTDRQQNHFAYQLQQGQQAYQQSHNLENSRKINGNSLFHLQQGSRRRASESTSGLGLDDDLSPSSMMNFESNDFSWMPPSEHNNGMGQSTTPQSILKGSGSFSPGSQNIPYNTVDSPLSLNISASGNGNGNGHGINYGVAHNAATLPGHVLAAVSPQHSIGSETSADNHNGSVSNPQSASTTSSLPLQGTDEFNIHGFPNFNLTGGPDDNHLPWDAKASFSRPVAPQIKLGLRITEQLRMHVLKLISAPTAFSSNQSLQIPSTQDLQRYIDAYGDHFGKHLPFLHHTLEFNEDNIALALGMAAIGALYCFERTGSFTIFEVSRSCIHIYLESRQERRNSNGTAELQNKNLSTPMWLVQSLVLGVIYGLFSGESLANEIAVAQANAVVSLAKSAGLHLPAGNFLTVPADNATLVEKWNYFVAVQERIRTMHVVHTICGLLTTSYNLTPSLENSDLKCGCPCDESLWTAQSEAQWRTILNRKGMDENSQLAIEGPNFAACLERLIQGETLVGKVPQFALLSLMYAIHLEINNRKTLHDRRFFEARRNSTVSMNSSLSPTANALGVGGNNAIINMETSNTAMRRNLSWLEQEKFNIESVLRAWETTWSLSPIASLSPSSQYGPLMSDSIPLSSLAHVRLYLDLRRVKEYFWKRDFVRMGQELDDLCPPLYYDSSTSLSSHQNMPGNSHAQKRFDGLLEAASYAADSISLWEKHSVKWTLEKTAIHTFFHTVIALFDCALVVSEFLYRLEKKGTADWKEEDMILAVRLSKILARVIRAVGPDGLDVPQSQLNVMDNGATVSSFSGELNEYMPMKPGGPQLSVISLGVVAKMLTKVYIWPFAQVLGEALQTRGVQIRRCTAEIS